MRTARVLTVSPSMLCGEGGVCSQGVCVCSWGGVCYGGCLLWRVSAPGCVCSRGVSAPGGVCLLPGGVCSGWGCLLQGGVYPSMHCRQTPPCEQNHTCLWKHNLASTSLRAVNISPYNCTHISYLFLHKNLHSVHGLQFRQLSPSGYFPQ